METASASQEAPKSYSRFQEKGTLREEAEATTKGLRAWAPKAVIVVSIALAFGAADIQQPFARWCGGYCKARQARATCHQAVAVQDLTAREREAEFAKCKADPLNYLPKQVTDGGEADSK
jgi:hypothetical protein